MPDQQTEDDTAASWARFIRKYLEQDGNVQILARYSGADRSDPNSWMVRVEINDIHLELPFSETGIFLDLLSHVSDETDCPPFVAALLHQLSDGLLAAVQHTTRAIVSGRNWSPHDCGVALNGRRGISKLMDQIRASMMTPAGGRVEIRPALATEVGKAELLPSLVVSINDMEFAFSLPEAEALAKAINDNAQHFAGCEKVLAPLADGLRIGVVKCRATYNVH